MVSENIKNQPTTTTWSIILPFSAIISTINKKLSSSSNFAQNLGFSETKKKQASFIREIQKHKFVHIKNLQAIYGLGK